MDISDPIVSVSQSGTARYPSTVPYNPDVAYPEYLGDIGAENSNDVYSLVRSSFYLLGLDSDNFGSENWNPFKDIVRPGDRVVIKPNLCKDVHHMGMDALLSTITHGSVVRPVIDYCLIALRGSGSITVCDTPFEHTRWDVTVRESGLAETVRLVDLTAAVNVRLLDLREYETEFLSGGNIEQRKLPGDPEGYSLVDLGSSSMFTPLDVSEQNYHTLADHTVDHLEPFSTDIGAPNEHHYPGVHEYRIANTILSSDVLISVPKLKTHGKTGVTLNVKNMIGTVAGKTYMPHHRPGMAPYGDAFETPPSPIYVKNRKIRRRFGNIYNAFEKRFRRVGAERVGALLRFMVLDSLFPARREKIIEWGDWSGNDTIWRTSMDVMTAALFATADGRFHHDQPRRFFSVIDGITGQEGQGPSAGEPIHSGLVISGFSPVSCDAVAASIMGFDPGRLPVVSGAASRSHNKLGESRLDRIEIRSDQDELPTFQFKTPRGWFGSIERTTDKMTRPLTDEQIQASD